MNFLGPIICPPPYRIIIMPTKKKKKKKKRCRIGIDTWHAHLRNFQTKPASFVCFICLHKQYTLLRVTKTAITISHPSSLIICFPIFSRRQEAYSQGRYLRNQTNQAVVLLHWRHIHHIPLPLSLHHRQK